MFQNINKTNSNQSTSFTSYQSNPSKLEPFKSYGKTIIVNSRNPFPIPGQLLIPTIDLPDWIQLRLVDQWSHVNALVEARPDPEVAQSGLQLLDELAEDGLLDQKLGSGRADLKKRHFQAKVTSSLGTVGHCWQISTTKRGSEILQKVQSCTTRGAHRTTFLLKVNPTVAFHLRTNLVNKQD